MSLKKYLTPKVIVERGEYVKDLDDNVFKVSDKTPTHDDDTVVKTNNRIQKTSKGLGGVELENIAQVISNTQDNRPQSADSYTAIDAAIGFTKDEASTFVKDKFGFKIKFKKKASPADIIDNTLNAVDKYKEKVKKAKISIDPYGAATNEVHASILKTLPTLNDIFDTVFEEQESNKQEQTQDTAQVGIDNTYVAPNLKNKFLLKQQQDLNAAKTLDPKAERSFREKYGTSSHMFQMKHDPVYEKKILNEAKRNPEQVDYPRNNTNRKDYVHPNNAFMFPNLKGESQANMVNQTNEFIAGELAGALPYNKIINKIKKLPDIAFSEIEEPLYTFVNKKSGNNAAVASRFMNKWYNDPKIQDRIQDLGHESLIDAFYNHPPEKINFKNYATIPEARHTSSGLSAGDFDNLHLNNSMLFGMKKAMNSTGVHEATHALTTNGHMFSPLENDMLLEPFGTDYTRHMINKSFAKEAYGKQSYFLDPTEIHARINEARYSLGKLPEDLVTEQEIESIIQKNDFFGMGSYIKNKSKMADLMNKFYGISGAGVAASQVDNKQQGGTLKGKLRPYPKMVGNRPMAIVDINKNKAVSVESIDKRTVSLDDIYDADSVKINGTNAKTFYKSKLNKYIK